MNILLFAPGLLLLLLQANGIAGTAICLSICAGLQVRMGGGAMWRHHDIKIPGCGTVSEDVAWSQHANGAIDRFMKSILAQKRTVEFVTNRTSWVPEVR